MRKIIILSVLCMFFTNMMYAQLTKSQERNLEKKILEAVEKQKAAAEEAKRKEQEREQRHERQSFQHEANFNRQMNYLNSISASDFMTGPKQQNGTKGFQATTHKIEDIKNNHEMNLNKPFIPLNMREGGTSRIYSEDLKWINPDRILPVPSTGAEVKAWDKLRESCSEEKLLLLAHSLKALNGGSIPSFKGYNDGNIVMYSPASEFDDTQKEKIFVVSPNGGRIFYLELENHDGKKENIFHKIEREEDVIDYNGETSGFGLGVSVSKNDDVTDEDNISFRIGGKDFKLESRGEYAVSKVIPQGNAKGEISLVDNSLKLSTKEVFINDYFAIEFGGTVTGGQKVSAEGKVYFDLDQKKAGVKADAGAELFSLGGNAKVNFVKNTKGNTCIVSYEIKADGGVKPSPMTFNRLFLDGSVDYESTITPINDLRKQIPSNIALAK